MEINNRVFSIVLMIIIISAGYGCNGPKEILEKTLFNVLDYGAFPDDGKDDTESLRNVVAIARTTPGSILFFPSGRYQITDPLALKIQEDAM